MLDELMDAVRERLAEMEREYQAQWEDLDTWLSLMATGRLLGNPLLLASCRAADDLVIMPAQKEISYAGDQFSVKPLEVWK